MRVLMVSWEYPPLIYGGLGRHVHGLSAALAADGHDVCVVTQGHPDAPADARVGGVRVVRVPPPPQDADFARWIAALNRLLADRGEQLAETWRPEVVHAHDWVSADAGIAVSRAAAAPLVATIHATEAGLWNGWITTPLSQARHDTEAWLVRAAARTIVCSQAMRNEVSAGLSVPADELTVVPNAVAQDGWQATTDQRSAIRAGLRIPSSVPVVVLAGRIEWEKGGDIAICALPRVRRTHPGTMLVVAGTGSQLPALEALARRLRVVRATRFAGHLAEADLAPLLATADVAIVPSSYEPFGMVAIEAGAAGTPVVAGAAGGLPELITPGQTGLLVEPRNSVALADAITSLLADPTRRESLVRAARRDIEARFVWPVSARATEKVYAEVLTEARPPRLQPRPVRPGNVFTGELLTS